MPGLSLDLEAPVALVKAGFIQPMLLLRTERLPEGPDWLYELKLDGYALAVKVRGEFNSARAMTRTSTPGIRPSWKLWDPCRTTRSSMARLWPSFNALQHHGVQMPV